MSGREVFEFRPELVDDDDAEADDTQYANNEKEEEEEEEVNIKCNTSKCVCSTQYLGTRVIACMTPYTSGPQPFWPDWTAALIFVMDFTSFF